MPLHAAQANPAKQFGLDEQQSKFKWDSKILVDSFFFVVWGPLARELKIITAK